MLNLKPNCANNLVAPTSMGVRITPVDRQPVQVSRNYQMTATSAESNVLNVAAALGMQTKVMTAFVKDSLIADFIKAELRFRNIAYEGPELDAGGPWGYRHQFNIADSGFGVRGARVQNDRAGEVGRSLDLASFDLERIFYGEGVQILHISGLIAALSNQTGRFCRELASYAKNSGTLISFDLNYRASFWAGREQELREVFTEIASLSDILIGNEEDYQLALGLDGPDSCGQELVLSLDGFRDMIAQARKKFHDTQVFATTLRQVISANRNLWGAVIMADDAWLVEEPREIDVLDRIGGGDGFVAGMLYGILRQWQPRQWLQFGWATGALATTMLNDYATPVNEQQVWSIYAGNARVQR